MKEHSLDGALSIFLDTEATPPTWRYHVTNRGRLSEAGAISSLDVLAEVLGRHGGLLTDLPWTELPTFGGPAPACTDGVWSWDERRLLMGTSADSLALLPRDGSDAARARGDFARPLPAEPRGLS
ncbi:hypothetical protein JY651_25700 [Pyxidicoccus parkwayensis]|uniref:Uncharacterized protein n=1 Tax=Pyxidicoccus parkwayensis TaxID=2813578 RepID=A0ABX7NMK7_9BACT|nr:hypothetical protein [Pyxidicoccus parkwaysis]QSQ18757.1 hypothetical protein JY651_25700 [Pyxidicoccus parkwaysis]